MPTYSYYAFDDDFANFLEGKQVQEDSCYIRRSALQSKVLYVTTLGGADAVYKSCSIQLPFDVYKLQDVHRQAKPIDAVP